ncbi:hypothetical protein PAAG_01026 [Paracoccidioides lutzii Pb01]|uniref:Uncharacterized protein n=1 Tax=Paracoccidioides lutzii (strain ATCC MYA-826 / Pb01) TaxID=502779 RepID=C1GR81_PARBA|nr:hypothetical protein PAAG_01026 [Paracoccidioides lutzii Pb01]EEH38105.2 hypothetical protein PAAG_01026 [Paracoccidioides lutzii Pb01]
MASGIDPDIVKNLFSNIRHPATKADFIFPLVGDSDRPGGTDITSTEALRVDHSHYPQQGSQHSCTRAHTSEDWASAHTIA